MIKNKPILNQIAILVFIGCTMWRTKCRFEEKVVGVVSADKEKNFTKYQIVVVQFVPTLANLGLRPGQFWNY